MNIEFPVSNGKSTLVGKFSIKGINIRIDGYPVSFVSTGTSRGGRIVPILVAIDGSTTMYSLGILGKTTKSGSYDAPNLAFQRDQRRVSTTQNKKVHSLY